MSKVVLIFAQILLGLLATSIFPIWAATITNDPAELSDIIKVIANIIRILAPAAAVAFLIMLLFGGYQFITSGGDPKSVAGARNTLTYAMLGVLLVVVVWFILSLIERVTGVNVTVVCWPGFCPP